MHSRKMATTSAGIFNADTRNESSTNIIPVFSSNTTLTRHPDTVNINVGRDQHNYTYQINYNSNPPQNTTAGASSSSGIVPSVSFNDAPLGILSAHFCGRQNELARMMNAFEVVRGDVPTRFGVYAGPGVGKSQLTLALAKESFAQGRYKCIFWMPATTVEKLHQGFSKLLHLVDDPKRSEPEEIVRLTAARRWLEGFTTGRWLLVLDNVVPETVDFLRKHLPRTNSHGNILFTTRTKKVAMALAHTSGEEHEILELGIPNEEDAAHLLLGHFKHGEIDGEESKAKEIAKCVGCLPLAIAQAAAYVKETGSTLDTLLAIYNSDHKIDMMTWENDLSTYQEKSVAATFIYQLDDLQQHFPDVSNLLKILAYFDPERIPLDMLIAGANVLSNSNRQMASGSVPTSLQKTDSFIRKVKKKILRSYKGKGKGQTDETSSGYSVSEEMSSLLALIRSPVGLPNAIAQLQNRSLTRQQGTGQSSSLWIHDLTQLIVLDNTKKGGAEREWYEDAVELACSAFNQVQDPESPGGWGRCEVLIPHIQSLTIRQGISGGANCSLLSANHRITGYLWSRGRYNDAEVLCNQVISSWEKLLGPEHVDTLSAKHNLALVYDSQDRYSDAEYLYKQVLASKEKVLGPEHVSILTTKCNLALAYKSQGRNSDAEYLYKQVLASEEKVLGPEHVSTLTTKHNLAGVYNAQGYYSDAEMLLKEVLSSLEKQLGHDHVHTLTTKYSLAGVYYAQGYYSDAEVLFKEVLSSREKQLGHDHVDTLTTKRFLAVVYNTQGRYAEAETLLLHVLAGFEKWLGLSHPDMQRAQRLLAKVYTNQGRLDDAEKMIQSVSPSPP